MEGLILLLASQMRGAGAACLLIGRRKLEEIDAEEKHEWFFGVGFLLKENKAAIKGAAMG